MKTAVSFIRALGRRCPHISVCEGLFKAARVSKGRRRSLPLPAQTLVAFCFIMVRQTGDTLAGYPRSVGTCARLAVRLCVFAARPLLLLAASLRLAFGMLKFPLFNFASKTFDSPIFIISAVTNAENNLQPIKSL